MTETAKPFTPDGLPVPRRYFALVAIWLAMTMSVLDSSIANVALPTIANDLHATAASSVWVVNASQLAVIVTLLPMAALGDRLGYRRVYLAGLTVFVIGALACALSTTLTQLTAARVLQGVGAGAAVSINSALIRFSVPAARLGRVIGYNATVVSIASVAGPTVAAAILAVASWQWLFAFNIPFGLLAIGLGAWALPRTIGGQHKFDLVSALLNAVTFGFLITGVERLTREGIDGLWMVGVGVAAGALLVYREMRHPAPLVPFDLLRSPIYGLSILTSIVSFTAQTIAFVGLPFYFQGPLERTTVMTGLLMTAWPLAVGVSAPFAGRLSDRHPAGVLASIGLFVLAIGLGLMSMIHPGSSNADIAWRLVVCGLGFGFFQSPNLRALVTSAPIHRSGAAGGMLATARTLGQTAGALTMAVFFHNSGPAAVSAALIAAAAISIVAMLVSLARLRVTPKQPTGHPDPQEAVIEVEAAP